MNYRLATTDDFEEIVDVNQTALGQFANDHSFLLDRRPDLFRT